jgi:acetyl-CoA carboxylase biotin carboxyl carrier protein
MTIQEIRELVQVVTESGIAELEVERGDNRVHIKRSYGVSQDVVLNAAPAPQPVHYVQAPEPAAQAAPHAAAASESGMQTIKAPIVGTFYESASPESASFVKVGDTVKAGQVLCIIESMKLMNEIESDFAGVIAAKLVENGSPVEYGEALFAIRAI